MSADGTQTQDDNYIVRGYATTFNQPYVLLKIGDTNIYEVVDKNALQNANMSQVKMFFEHKGHILARTENGTLKLIVDNKGLYFEADLSKSLYARNCYEEIKNGLICDMSWAYIPSEVTYDQQSKTRTITKIKLVTDVSPVTYPANNYAYVK